MDPLDAVINDGLSKGTNKNLKEINKNVKSEDTPPSSSSESSEDLKFLQEYVSNEFKRHSVEAWESRNSTPQPT